MSRASCAVFYSDTRARGAVFHSDEKFRQYIDISISFQSIICIKSKCVFPLPYRYLDSTVCRASCAVFYSDTRAPGAVFHSDTKVRQWTEISLSVQRNISMKSYVYFLSPIGAVTQECLGHPARCLILTQGHLARCFILTLKAPGEVFHSDTRVMQYIDISIYFYSHICIRSY